MPLTNASVLLQVILHVAAALALRAAHAGGTEAAVLDEVVLHVVGTHAARALQSDRQRAKGGVVSGFGWCGKEGAGAD
jgi:hypothetical protein